MRTLRIFVTLFLMTVLVSTSVAFKEGDFEDNEFAEFEEDGNVPVEAEATVSDGSEDEFEDSASSKKSGSPDIPVEGVDEEIEDEEEEDSEDILVDDFDQEFETDDSPPADNQPPPVVTPPKPIKAAEIPNHLRTNWDSFVIEMIVLGGLVAYLVNFFVGKSKNYKLANAWLTAHRGIFESNFAIVGDDGSGTEVVNGVLMKESENVYSLWCSGRTCVEGMLCELKLLKRQCLVAILANMLKPGKSDQLHVRVDVNKEDMDTFVMAVGNKKTIARMAKELNDLSSLAGEKKAGEKLGLGSSIALVSEIGEASSAILDSKVVSLLSKYEECLDAIHITDQYTGAKSETAGTDSSTLKTPLEPLKQIRCVFNVPGKGKSKPEDVEALRPLVQLVFHLIDKIKRVRLSKEAKRKADLNRAKIEESHLKMTHSQRQELAQQRREEKRRADKDKMMAEEDPDKQRRWEEAQYKRDMKKKAPRVKQMKMKAM